MRRFQNAVIGAAALVSAVGFTSVTEAAPVPQGTVALSAERLAASNVHVQPGPAVWVNQFFGAPGMTPFDTPRLGFDYFVIDGLSIGAHFGLGLYAHNEVDAWIALIPRVGYAFSIGRRVDFWPRVGVGLIAGDAAGNDTGVLSMEGMFLINMVKHVDFEVGPAVDLPFGGFWPDAIIGGNAGIVARF